MTVIAVATSPVPELEAPPRNVDLLHQLRAVLPDADATYIGRLNDRDALAIVTLFLYVRRTRASVPASEAVSEPPDLPRWVRT